MCLSIGGEWWMVNEWWNSAARVTFKEASEASEHQKARPWRQIKATSRAVIDDGIFNHVCCLMLALPPSLSLLRSVLWLPRCNYHFRLILICHSIKFFHACNSLPLRVRATDIGLWKYRDTKRTVSTITLLAQSDVGSSDPVLCHISASVNICCVPSGHESCALSFHHWCRNKCRLTPQTVPS